MGLTAYSKVGHHACSLSEILEQLICISIGLSDGVAGPVGPSIHFDTERSKLRRKVFGPSWFRSWELYSRICIFLPTLNGPGGEERCGEGDVHLESL